MAIHQPKRNSDQHHAKMARKARIRAGQPLDITNAWFAKHYGANINLRTGKPHEHKREIARRLGAA